MMGAPLWMTVQWPRRPLDVLAIVRVLLFLTAFQMHEQVTTDHRLGCFYAMKPTQDKKLLQTAFDHILGCGSKTDNKVNGRYISGDNIFCLARSRSGLSCEACL
jgi:hypothetical protein